MTFKEIEKLGVRLPPSAYNHRAWWANSQGTGLSSWTRDAVEKPWQRANFETVDVDMKSGDVTFRYRGGFSQKGLTRQAEARARQKEESRAATAHFLQSLKQPRIAETASGQEAPQEGLFKRLSRQAPPSATHNPQDGKSHEPRRHPAYGALKGHIRLVAGTDLTKPANPHKDHNKP
jgi:hypothetical protein